MGEMLDEFEKSAKLIFEKNLQTGYSKWKKSSYEFIAPASVEYTFQWLWDTSFHAIVLSHFDPEWAKREIRTFLQGQFEDGFLPHVIFWDNRRILPHWAYLESNFSIRPHTTNITQPPMLAIAVEQIFDKTQDKNFLKEVLPKISSFHGWLLANRDPDSDYLISIISPNESGMDELPDFQYAAGYKGNNMLFLRYYYRKADLLSKRYNFDSAKILEKDYFNVEELLFNTVFIEANRSLSRLYAILGQSKESQFFKKAANKSENALLNKCWNKKRGFFYSLYSKREHQVAVKSIAGLMPLYLDGLKGEKLEKTIEHLTNPKEFWTPYPIPSVAKSEHYYIPHETPFYRGKMLWRGPTWVNTNWFVVKGLRKHGYHALADEIVGKMAKMIEKWGYREFYNPETGEGYRRKDFGWSTLIVDLL